MKITKNSIRFFHIGNSRTKTDTSDTPRQWFFTLWPPGASEIYSVLLSGKDCSRCCTHRIRKTLAFTYSFCGLLQRAQFKPLNGNVPLDAYLAVASFMHYSRVGRYRYHTSFANAELSSDFWSRERFDVTPSQTFGIVIGGANLWARQINWPRESIYCGNPGRLLITLQLQLFVVSFVRFYLSRMFCRYKASYSGIWGACHWLSWSNFKVVLKRRMKKIISILPNGQWALFRYSSCLQKISRRKPPIYALFSTSARHKNTDLARISLIPGPVHWCHREHPPSL